MSLSCLSRVKRTSDITLRPACVSNFVDNVFVGDRSGSMYSLGTIPQEGAVNFMKLHKTMGKENPNSNIHITMYSFDNTSSKYYDGEASNITKTDISCAKKEMEPRGTTALYDSVIRAIKDQQKRIDSIKDSFSNEVNKLKPIISLAITVFTDGVDNQSDNSSYDLKKYIENHR